MTEPRIIRAPREMQSFAEAARARGQRVVVVPTMGYLHEGHVSLLRLGRTHGDLLVMTLFVNPTQFGENEDLGRYPRDEAGDVAKAASASVDIVFAPDRAAMYAPDHETTVSVHQLAKPLCGASRPGHFTGVASVVTKLFHLTVPHVAVFGEKDYQQLAILRRMVRDLDFNIEIVSGPIVREADGLALSSRNAYLSKEERSQAPVLNRALHAARQAFAGGERDARALEKVARDVISTAPLADIDYLELRDAADLSTLERAAKPAVLALAVRFGKTRLIDNLVLS